METRAPVFTSWLDDFFAAYYRRRPVNATFIGVHSYDDRLPDLSEWGVAETLAEMKTLLQRLHDLPSETLTLAEALDRQLAEGFLEIQRWEYESAHFQRGNPGLYTSEAVFGAIALFLRPFAPIQQRIESAIARLQAIPTLLAQCRANVHQAPAAWTEHAIRDCGGALAFLDGGVDSIIREHSIDGTRLRASADLAKVAFDNLQHYLETDLRARPSEHYACGGDAFDLLLRKGHFLDRNAEAIEAYAQMQFDACAASLDERARDLGARTRQEALAGLAARHPSIEQYYSRYGEVWHAARDAAEAHRLLTWPDYPIHYVPEPVWARAASPSLYFLPYRSPAPFDSVAPVEYLVTPIEPEMDAAEQDRRLRAANDSVIKLNHVIHHGGLGHHVQNWHAFRAASRIGQVAAVDCASRIALFCGGTMAEGWACYATELMDEIGFLTPLEHYAQDYTRLRMAARALVDVRLHHEVFTLQDAVTFYRDRVGMSDEAAREEAVKNSMFPGAALMYLHGTALIHELRRDLAALQGATFSLRRFHDRFLSFGSIPVSLICRTMREEAGWMNETHGSDQAVHRGNAP